MGQCDMSNKADHFAYDPAYNELEAVMRMHAVKRWHMIDTTRTQTLAEHSANVAMLAFVIVNSPPGAYFGSASQAAIYGLMHDIPEAFTGDIPTHTKRWFAPGVIDNIEAAVTPPSMVTTEIPGNVKELIKLCDLADGIRFIWSHGVDVTADHARKGLEKQYWERVTGMYLAWPESITWHVLKHTYFYAYETGVNSTTATVPPNAWAMVADMARRQRNNTGGA